MSAEETILVGHYDCRLVVLSVLIAILGGYCTIELAGRVTGARGRARVAWLIGGAIAMGVGTWSMHYVGMLAFRLPIPVLYDWVTSFQSYLASVFASAVGLYVVSRRTMGLARALAGSILMGGGIAALHYIAMEAMRLKAMCHYSPMLVALSILLAIIISLVALWMMFLFRQETIGRNWRKIPSILLLGAAVPVMHYTGMASVTYRASADLPDLSHAVSISALGVTGIALANVMVLIVLIVTSVADRFQKANEQLQDLSGHLLRMQDEEHRHIARELHDSVAQELLAVAMNLGELQKRVGRSDPTADNILSDSLAIIEQCGSEIRTISQLLHPALLDELGLARALRHYIAAFAERSGIAATFDAPPELGPLPSEIEAALFRVVQESLGNVHRHSGSQTAAVRLRSTDSRVELEIEDHGHGLPPALVTGGGDAAGLGVGILGMRERLRQLGGRLDLKSTATGVIVRATVPLPEVSP